MEQSIYLFGAGKMLKACSQYFNWNSVIAILDNDKDNIGRVINGKRIIHPREMDTVRAREIIICVKHHVDEIVSQLLCLGITINHIHGIGCWIKHNCPNEEIAPYETTQSLYDYVGKLGCGNIIQIGNLLAHEAVYFKCDERLSRWGKFYDKRISLLKIQSECDEKNDMPALYDRIYCKLEDIDKVKYDAAIISGNDIKISFHALKRMIAELPVNHVILDLSVISTIQKNDYDAMHEKFKNLAKHEITWHRSFAADFIDIKKGKDNKDKAGIYVVSHKQFDMPPLFDSGYHTIWVGRNAEKFDGINDNTGDNIAYLNPVINECTAIYWLWKNCNDDYIGICHYRRFFLHDANAGKAQSNIMGSGEALAYLEEYDMLVSNPAVLYQYEGEMKIMGQNVDPDAMRNGMRIVMRLLRERQPDYVDAFDKVMSGVMMFPCNMMVTRKDIFDKYCEWLFSFLIDAAKEFDPTPYDDYSKRMIGFIAERMLTVWLLKQNLKIKTLPVLLLK